MIHVDHQHAVEVFGQARVVGVTELYADIVEPVARNAFGERIARTRGDVLRQHAPCLADAL